MRTLAVGSARTGHRVARGNPTDRPDRRDALVRGICTRALALAIAMACVGSVGATPLEQGGGAPLGIGSAEHVSYASTDLRGDAAPALDRGATAVVTEAPLAGTGASGALVINATFDTSITNDANSTAIETMINNALSIYESLFNDPITVSILFRYSATDPHGTALPPGALAHSNWVFYTEPWNTYINALTADATTANDATANASLPASAVSTNMRPSSANGRAVSLNTPPAMFVDGSVGPGGPYDGIVTLNSNQPFGFTRPPTTAIYDARRSTEHEIDEVLGFGSYLTLGGSDLRPQDLFSWSAAGMRNLMSSGSRYFSIDGGATNIVGFNQNASGDFGDWLSDACPQGNPYVQNAFSCQDQAMDVIPTSPEGINLDVIGYDLITTTASTTTSTATTTTTHVAATTTTLPCTTARCIVEGAETSAACAGQTIPASVTAKLTQAENLIDQAATSATKKAAKLLKKAKRALKQAGARATRAAKGKRPKISAGCAAAITTATDTISASL